MLDLGWSRLQNHGGYSNIDQAVSALSDYLFDFDYPMYDSSHKQAFQQAFIRAYLLREIGFETPALFKLFLQSKLLQIMPYYNILYKINDLIEQVNLMQDRDLYRNRDNKDYVSQKVSDNIKDNNKGATEDINNSTVTSKGDAENWGNNSSTVDGTKTTTGTDNTDTTVTNNLTDATNYGRKEERDLNYQRDNIGQNNGAVSDFPQANVYNTTNMYYTQGNEANIKQQENYATNKDNTTLSGTDTIQHTGNVKTLSNLNKNDKDVSHNMTVDILHDNSKNSSETAEEADRKKYEIYENLREALNELKKAEHGRSKEHEYGLTGARTPFELMEQFKNLYVNVDAEIIRECNDLFMLIY